MVGNAGTACQRSASGTLPTTATGCTLAAADRPGRCVHYTCTTLRRELRARGDLARIDTLLDGLQRAQQRFAELHRTRLDDELLAPLEAAVLDLEGGRR